MSIKKNIKFVEKSLDGHNTFRELENKFKDLNKDYRRADLEDELLEIYEDESGNIIDVCKIDIKKRRRWVSLLRNFIFSFLILGVLLTAFYLYFFQFKKNSSGLLSLEINAPTEVVSGQESFYTIKYKNLTGANLRDLSISGVYPDGFVFSESLPSPDSNNNTWSIGELAAHDSGEIKIKGKIINEEASFNQFNFKANYLWSGFSTEFKSQVITSTLVKGLGIEINLAYSQAVLLGETGEIVLNFRNNRSAYEELELVTDFPEGFSLLQVSPKLSSKISLKDVSDNTFRVLDLDADGDQSLIIKYKADSLASSSIPKIELRQRAENGKDYILFKKEINLEVVNSDLNLLLSVNGQASDKAVDFGDTLNYSLKYYNRGKTSVNDLIIMVNIDGDFINWDSLKDRHGAEIRDNSLVWTKDQIPGLASLAPGEEGLINFSLNLLPYQDTDYGKKMTVISQAEFSVAGQKAGEDNHSSQIINQINSDLSFTEKILYFDEDNIPVGSGPLPPQVGQYTSFRVYWTIQNSLHELSDVVLEYNLPLYTEYDGKSQGSIGNIDYDSESRKIRWQISSLDTSMPVSTAQFDIKISPQLSDRGRIVVLSVGSVLRAFDTETQNYFGRDGSPKTTRLEDDNIASLNNDGVIR